ncbi:MAG: phage replisome organizer N-terminal domain-containing protein [Agitococcus sp.]|nr:phage replisome organizer N-terminal domain-containing protein [Agitococcus sp.]
MMKKFIWLKLRDDFFMQPKIKKLRKIAGGDTLTVIYLKMMLLSIKTDGVIEYQGIEKGLADELALILDEEESNVNITLLYLEKMGLIETLSESSYLLPEVPPLVGSEGDSAERMRRLRSKNKELPSQCDTHVTICDKKVTTEKEKEGEKEKLLLPDCIPQDIWNTWVKYRVDCKLTNNNTTLVAQLAQLETWFHAGYEPAEIIKNSILQGWKGLFEPKQSSSKALALVPPWVQERIDARNKGEALTELFQEAGFNNVFDFLENLNQEEEVAHVF